MAKRQKKDALEVRKDSFFETFQSLEDKIRRRAYELFEDRDGDEGDHMSDWLEAQSEVLTSIALNFEEEEDRYVLSGDVPAEFEPGEIEIDITDGMLSVGGTHKQEVKKSGKDATSYARSEVNFMRRLSLPSDADTDAIDTVFDGRNLRVTLPKANH